MAWKDDLVPASFRGIVFDCISTQDTFSRDIASYSYPYKQGADIEDLGRKPTNIRMSAIFFGRDYEKRLQAFLAAINQVGNGELIHPVFGSYPKVQLIECAVHHDAENVDTAHVELVFLEAAPDLPFFNKQYPAQISDTVYVSTQSIFDNAMQVWNTNMMALQSARYTLERYRNLAQTAEYMIQSLSHGINGVAGSAFNYLHEPAAFMSDLKGLLHSVTDNLSLSETTVISDWKSLTRTGDNAVSSPATIVGKASIPSGDVNLISQSARLVVANQYANTASGIFLNELTTPTLSIDNISDILANCRTMIVAAINAEYAYQAVQQQQGLEKGVTVDARESYQIVDNLKTLAFNLQTQAHQLILSRPPLITRIVESDCNLHLLAHWWYNDASRADELRRLNPSLRSPNKIKAGQTLYAYAR